MVMEDGNGHDPGEIPVREAFKGAVLNLDELKREDGILTIPQLGGQGGVLHRAMTAVNKDTEYRQELKTAFFLSTNEADLVVAAINEAKRYGCSLTPIVDWLVARSSGVHGGRLKAIFETLSHTTFTTNYTGKNTKKWWSNDKSKSSPLS